MFRARFGRGAYIVPKLIFSNIQTLITFTFTQIQSLRTAFTLNTALKRLFLSSTSMTSAGAIALAEFLPESTSLLHLDLTMNELDIAGVMALSSGLKANHVMRCLDLNIPPGDEEFARSVLFFVLVYPLKGFFGMWFIYATRMCREILNSCVRNTEEAERASKAQAGGVAGATSSGRGLRKGIWGMIEESELAKSIRLKEDKRVRLLAFFRDLRFVFCALTPFWNRMNPTLWFALGHA
jgi:protein phosphatase 1 regulatory subunit 37